MVTANNHISHCVKFWIKSILASLQGLSGPWIGFKEFSSSLILFKGFQTYATYYDRDISTSDVDWKQLNLDWNVKGSDSLFINPDGSDPFLSPIAVCVPGNTSPSFGHRCIAWEEDWPFHIFTQTLIWIIPTSDLTKAALTGQSLMFVSNRAVRQVFVKLKIYL